MKKHLIFCIAFLALLASCMKEPQIHRRLTDEEAAAIPYHLGQTVNFVNQNDDTLTYTVVFDTTCLDNEMDFLFWSNSKLKINLRILPKPSSVQDQRMLEQVTKALCLAMPQTKLKVICLLPSPLLINS